MSSASPSAWLGLDLGTSSCKALLVDQDGALLAEAREPVSLEEPEPLAAEQEAGAWWTAAADAIRVCLHACPEASVAGVGLTGQKHALLALDERREPVGRALLWCDGRAASHVEDTVSRVGDLAERTGAPALAGYLVPKWLRLLSLERERMRGVRHLCFAKDWLRLCLTGVLATDRTEASSSQLWDGTRDLWDPELLEAFEIPPGGMPPVYSSTAVTGHVGAAAAARTGLLEGTSVVAGAGDNEAAALACGAVRPGVVALVLGTSGTVVAPAACRGPVGGLVWGDSVLQEGLFATGTVLSSGRALAWFARVAFDGDVEALITAASEAPENDVPLFLPTLVGERSPVPDAHAAGSFVGLRPHHGRAALARAVVEGVALSLGRVVEALREAGVAVEELRLVGEGARSPLFRALLAAASRIPVRLAGAREGSARGAALLATLPDAQDAALVARAEAWTAKGVLEVPAADRSERLGRAAEAQARLGAALRELR